MAVWETEDEGGDPTSTHLPTPVETPIRTPSRDSRRTRRSVTPPNQTAASPIAVVAFNERGDRVDAIGKRSSKDLSNDDNISILDPRRFTPTLHANLVSEILNLRRDQQGKSDIIERLETSLQIAKDEEAVSHARLLDLTKENRALKRQLSLLEGGSSTAFTDLSRERDEALNAAVETRSRIESLQKRLRIFEDDSKRTNELWDTDRKTWEDEKRRYERMIHVADSRLRTVLDEVAASHATDFEVPRTAAESDGEESTKENDGASMHSMSRTNSLRFSTIPGKLVGPSLADELDLDGDSDDQTDTDGRESVMSNRPAPFRAGSRDSVLSMRSHGRHRSTENSMRPGSTGKGRIASHTPFEMLKNGVIQEDDEAHQPMQLKPAYTDTATQYTPPPSPAKPMTPEPPLNTVLASTESPEANQRKKRVSASGRPLSIHARPLGKGAVSAAVQLYEGPLSPPKTPKSLYADQPISPRSICSREMVSSATQTDVAERDTAHPGANNSLLIPSISIHPPLSRPNTPREPLLPQLTKDFGCQVSIEKKAASTTSTAVQTEEIRVDTRLDRLPPHLHPSAIHSRVNTPSPEPSSSLELDRNFTPVPGTAVPPRNPRRLTSQQSNRDLGSSPPAPSGLMGADFGRNGSPTSYRNNRMSTRKSNRFSQFFSGFDNCSSDEGDEFADGDLSDSEYQTALSAPKPKLTSSNSSRGGGEDASLAKSTFRRPSGLPPRGHRRSMPKLAPRENESSRQSDTRGSSIQAFTANPRPSAARERTSKQSQTNLGQGPGALDSSTLLEPQRKPPFPIPARASSRLPFSELSVLNEQDQTPTKKAPWMRRAAQAGHQRTGSIRKVKSAAAVAFQDRSRAPRSRSPPLNPHTGSRIDDMPPPPIPLSAITSPRGPSASTAAKKHTPQGSSHTAATDFTGHHSHPSQSTGSQQTATSVVDAIAQTMVGEWMFKYVRRRKSFGVGNDGGGGGKDDSSNDRHKRWVWLAPYDRAILWSNKQPSSGSALLGKSGRKLTIQSVLDVKDENAAPKGSDEIFNRSILILTPQRALKFTAINAERHYVWLNALSFLAHSQQDVPEIPALSSKQLQQFELVKPKTRRPGIRDSIRLAKGKGSNSAGTRSVSSSHAARGGAALSSVADVPPSLASFRAPEPEASAYAQRVSTSHDAAEPPTVPRFNEQRESTAPTHVRKRSNTAGHMPPPISYRGQAGTGPSNSSSSGGGRTSQLSSHGMSNGNSIGTAGSIDNIHSAGATSSLGGWGMSSVGETRRTSDASSAQPGRGNFFDAIGTMRMEAFISPLAFTQFEVSPEDLGRSRQQQTARRRSKEIRRRRSRSRHRDNGSGSRNGGVRNNDGYQSGGDAGSQSRAADEQNYFRDNLFAGF